MVNWPRFRRSGSGRPTNYALAMIQTALLERLLSVRGITNIDETGGFGICGESPCCYVTFLMKKLDLDKRIFPCPRGTMVNQILV